MEPAPSKQDAGEALRAYAEAQRLAQEGVAISRQTGHRHELAMCNAILGVAESKLGLRVQARQHVFEALQAGSYIGGFWPLMLALPGAALLLADAAGYERAVELYALASCYPYVANSCWFYDVFGRHIDAVAATLPQEVAEAARERGRARDLQATVKELLVELVEWRMPASDSPEKDA